jgi:hypothetical protein
MIKDWSSIAIFLARLFLISPFTIHGVFRAPVEVDLRQAEGAWKPTAGHLCHARLLQTQFHCHRIINLGEKISSKKQYL